MRMRASGRDPLPRTAASIAAVRSPPARRQASRAIFASAAATLATVLRQLMDVIGTGAFAVSDGDCVVVVDPFFAGAFAWQNGRQHLIPDPAPMIRQDDIAEGDTGPVFWMSGDGGGND